MKRIYDFIGIGIGPYNLSLAALTEDIKELDGIFFEETEQFNWHPGMLIEGMDLQTPFFADLVTFADPTNRYSFLNYLHNKKRLYPFFFLRELEIPRQEYNDYLQWVAGQMDGLLFGKRVVHVVDEGIYYKVYVQDVSDGNETIYFTKHVIMATGTEPTPLKGMENYPVEDVLHTDNYLFKKEELLESNAIAVVGSGQSAAEIFLDLLIERENRAYQLTWLTRSEGIFQKEAAKMGREFYSPEYITYFHSLPLEQRKEAMEALNALHSEIDADVINAIYTKIYEYSIGGADPKVTIQPMTEVNGIEKHKHSYILNAKQWQLGQSFDYKTDKVIFATGYKPRIPEWFLDQFGDQIVWEEEMLFKVGRNYDLQFKDNRKHRFYVVTNIEHSHGVASTSLALAAQRNMELINHILEKDYFDLEYSHAFQQFSVK